VSLYLFVYIIHGSLHVGSTDDTPTLLEANVFVDKKCVVSLREITWITRGY